MRSQARKLLEDIEHGAVNSEVPLATVLRKCVMFGGYTKSGALQQWARRELDGYSGVDDIDVPSYRLIPGKLHLLPHVQLRGQVAPVPFSSDQLPEEIRKKVNERVDLRNGVGSLETLISGSDDGFVQLSVSGGEVIAAYFTARQNQPGLTYLDCFTNVATASIEDILHAVRDKLVGLVAEIISTLPDDDAAPTREAVANAVAVHITGETVSHVTVVTSQAADSSVATTHNQAAPTAEKSGKKWVIIGTVAGVIGAIAAVWALFLA